MVINEEVVLKRIMKKNVIALVKHHKKHCDGEHCKISLWLLKEMAERSGIKFTECQVKLFI